MRKILFVFILLFICCLYAANAAAQENGSLFTAGDYEYTLDEGTAAIVRYTGSETGQITVPPAIDGYPVTVIGDYAFQECPASSIVLPDTITEIEKGAFSHAGPCSISLYHLPRSIWDTGHFTAAAAWNPFRFRHH